MEEQPAGETCRRTVTDALDGEFAANVAAARGVAKAELDEDPWLDRAWPPPAGS